MPTFTNLTGNTDGVDRTSYSTASVSPTANRLILVSISTYMATGSANPPQPTVTGNGITYTLAKAQDVDTAGADRTTMWVFRGMSASPSAGAITIDFGGTTVSTCAWSVDQSSSDVDTTGTNGSGAMAQTPFSNNGNAITSLSINYPTAMTAGNAGFSAFAHQVNQVKTERTNWTELFDTNGSTNSLETQYRDATDTAVSASWATSSRAGGIGLEIKKGGQSAAVTLASETDSALMVGEAKPVGIASETDSAVSVGEVRAVVLASETDTAGLLGISKGVGVAVETDAAGLFGISKGVGAASETDTALAIVEAGGQSQAVTLASETDTAVAVTQVKARAVGTAVETDSAGLLGKVKGAQTAIETDTAVAVTAVKAKAVTLASETDSALLLGISKGAQAAVETDTAGTITAPAVGLHILNGFSNNSGASSTRDAQATLPTGIATGDKGLYLVTYPSGTITHSTPSGWDLIAGPITNTGNTSRGYTYERDMVSSDSGGTVGGTNALSSAARWAVSGVIITGPPGPAPGTVDSNTNTTTSSDSTSVPTSATTPVMNDTMLVNLLALRSGSAGSLTAVASGYTEVPNSDTCTTATAFTGAVCVSKKLVGQAGVSQGSVNHTCSPTSRGVQFTVTVAAIAQTVAITFASETDTAQRAIVSPRAATETDTALPITRAGQGIAVGTASETDTAQVFGRVSTAAVTLASETDTASVLGRVKTIPIGPPSVVFETDTAQAIGRVSTTAVTLAAETDTSQPGIRVKSHLIGVGSETDTAQALGRVSAKPVTLASETDTALTITPVSVVALQAAAEVDSALALGRVTTKAVTFAAETDTAGVFGGGSAVSVTMAVETDTARIVGRARMLGAAAEADSAGILTRLKIRAITFATETDSAGAVGIVAGDVQTFVGVIPI